MEVVIVEFAAGLERTGECVRALRELMAELVAKQPAFRGATLHVEESTGAVLNIMRWDQAGDFVRFRDSNQDVIGKAIGRFEPSPRFLCIEAEIAAGTSP